MSLLPRMVPSPGEKVDVQTTSFSVDAYARLVCSTLDEAWDAAHGDFDMVVIGSGMYGAFAATKLYHLSEDDRKPRILVLDAGHFVLPEHVDNLPRLAKDDVAFEQGGIRGFPYLDSRSLAYREQHARGERHHYCIGGKSIAWGKWAPRLLESDLVHWPQQLSEYLRSTDGYDMVELETGVAEETSFIRGELLNRLVQRAHEVSAGIDGILDPARWPAKQPPIAAQGSSPASGLFSFDAFSSLAALLDAVREDIEISDRDDEKRKLFIVPRCRVHRLDHRAGKMAGLHVLAGEPMAPRYLPLPSHCRVIMALNSMESTRLALVSELPEPVSGPLMGRNLMAHLRSGFTVRMRREALGPDLPEALQAAALHVQGDRGNRRFHFQIFAGADLDYNAFRVIYKMMPDVESMQKLLDGQRSGYVTMRVLTVGEMLRGASSVRIATANDDPAYQDRIGGVIIPKIYADWQLAAERTFWTEMDRTAFAFVKAMAGENSGFEIAHPDGSWRPDLPDLDCYQDSASSTFHEAGTLWMGDDPENSVTAPDGRFHRVDNLYCVDQAVFPTVGSANPVLTGLTVTRFVVDKILNATGRRRQRASSVAGGLHGFVAGGSVRRDIPVWNR